MMVTANDGLPREPVAQSQEVSLATLIDHLGVEAAREFFKRIDGQQRRGQVIMGYTVRGSRHSFSRAYTTGQAQFVTPGRPSEYRPVTFSDSVVIMKMDDFEAVVKAGQKPFDWVQLFAPRAGLEAATTMPTLKRASQGRRQLRA